MSDFVGFRLPVRLGGVGASSVRRLPFERDFVFNVPFRRKACSFSCKQASSPPTSRRPVLIFLPAAEINRFVRRTLSAAFFDRREGQIIVPRTRCPMVTFSFQSNDILLERTTGDTLPPSEVPIPRGTPLQKKGKASPQKQKKRKREEEKENIDSYFATLSIKIGSAFLAWVEELDLLSGVG